jgi:hypothetical protein
VSAGVFSTFGVPVVGGRAFADADDGDAPPVMIVNRRLAERFWPGADPLGARITMLGRSWEIVGVVDDLHQFTLAEQPGAQIFLPHPQVRSGWMRRRSTVGLRTAGPPEAVAEAARNAVRLIDPTIPVSNVRTMSAVVAATTAPQRFRALLTSAFAFAALVLGATGVFGIVTFAVARRTREYGIRMAVGATSRNLVHAAVAGGMRPVLVGIAAGAVGALLVGQTLAALLFEVRPVDPPTLVAAALILGGVALFASYVPARRVTRVDPMQALRTD